MPSERVVFFFARMEELFLQMKIEMPSESVRVRIIQRNLLPDYVKALSMIKFGTVVALKEACKCLEAGFDCALKNMSQHQNDPTSVNKSVRFSDRSISPAHYQRYSRYDNYRQRNWSNDRSSSNERQNFNQNNKPSFYQFNNSNSQRYRSPNNQNPPANRSIHQSASYSRDNVGPSNRQQYTQSNNSRSPSWRGRSPQNQHQRQSSDNISENYQLTSGSGLPIGQNSNPP